MENQNLSSLLIEEPMSLKHKVISAISIIIALGALIMLVTPSDSYRKYLDSHEQSIEAQQEAIEAEITLGIDKIKNQLFSTKIDYSEIIRLANKNQDLENKLSDLSGK